MNGVVFNGRDDTGRGKNEIVGNDFSEAEEMLRLVESVYEDEPDVFTKRSFLLDMADSPEIGERVLELLEHSS